jgi:16S rRNA (guanine527-N7)-methyltransferase
MDTGDLIDVLTRSQQLGFLGRRPVAEVVEHASGFVQALAGVTGHVVDLGSGGGVPGFVIASARSDLEVTLIDRRTKRTDFLERMVHKYGLRDRVHVIAGDTDDVVIERGGTFDAAVARGFGPPEITLATGATLVKIGGLVVISEPPEGDRWSLLEIDDVGVERVSTSHGVVVFQRTT